MLNPSLQYYNELVEFVQKTYAHYDINYFAIGRVYRDGRLHALHSNPDWAIDHLVKNKLPPAGLTNIDELESNQLFFRSEGYDQKLGWTEGSYLAAKAKFNIRNPLIYFFRNDDYVDQYFIDIHNPDVVNIYLNQQSEIQNIFKTIKYQFKDLINTVSKEPLVFESQYITEQKALAQKKNPQEQTSYLFHNNQLIKISSREYSCLANLAKGARIKDTASLLKISPRTVETHINAIKMKLNIPSTKELIACYWKSITNIDEA